MSADGNQGPCVLEAACRGGMLSQFLKQKTCSKLEQVKEAKGQVQSLSSFLEFNFFLLLLLLSSCEHPLRSSTKLWEPYVRALYCCISVMIMI